MGDKMNTQMPRWLVVVLALWVAPVQSELIVDLLTYDTGIPNVSSGDALQGVRFSVPPAAAPARLLSVQFELSENTPQTLNIHFRNEDLSERLSPFIQVQTNDFYTIIDVQDRDIEVPETFFVVLEVLTDAQPVQDTRLNLGRSRGGNVSPPTSLTRTLAFNLILRAEVEFEDDVFANGFESGNRAAGPVQLLLN